MKQAAFVFIINLLFLAVTFTRPHTAFYHVWEQPDILQFYANNITSDTGTYAHIVQDPLRTVGYPALLYFLQLFENWFFILMGLNCFLGAWLFYMAHKMIGWKVWILFALGAFTIYTKMVLTDLFFAALFVTSIWQIKKRLWLHFLLLGLASLVRPSLAWFFVIEPFVLYFYGYRGSVLLVSVIITFYITMFSPLRNFVNGYGWIHSNILQWNMDNLYEGPLYFFKAFEWNCLHGHQLPIPRTMPNGLINAVLIGINSLIWGRFFVRVVRNKINWGNVLMVAYFIGPSLFGASGARFRLPIEWMLL